MVDAATGLPLAWSPVTVTDGPDCTRQTRTNKRGEFAVGPEYGHFITWLGGPFYEYEGRSKASIDVAVKGYLPYHKDFAFRWIPESSGNPGRRSDDYNYLTNDYIAIGDVEIRKTP